MTAQPSPLLPDGLTFTPDELDQVRSFTVPQVAALLNYKDVSPVYRLIKQRKLKANRGSGEIRVTWRALYEYQHGEPPPLGDPAKRPTRRSTRAG